MLLLKVPSDPDRGWSPSGLLSSLPSRLHPTTTQVKPTGYCDSSAAFSKDATGTRQGQRKTKLPRDSDNMSTGRKRRGKD